MKLFSKSLSFFPNNFYTLIALTSIVLGIISCQKEEFLTEASDLCLVEIDGNFEEANLDKEPEFLAGGKTGFRDELLRAVKYPPEARETGKEGLSIVQYEITKNGSVENFVIIQDPGGGIGDATKEALSQSTAGTAFSPGILNGNAVRVRKELGLRFRLE